MTKLQINGFDIATSYQHEVRFAKDKAALMFRPAEGEILEKLLSAGARMQQLKKRPPEIRNLPFVLSFNSNNSLSVYREAGGDKIDINWSEIDGMIIAVREAVNIVNSEIKLAPRPRGGHQTTKSFGPGDPFA